MAEQEIVNSPAADGGMASVSGKSSADILSMINQPAQPQVNPVQATGSQPQAQGQKPVEQKPQEVKQPSVFDELDKVPDKFKNPDGTIDVKRMLGSYLEAEKTLSKLSNVSHETKQAQTELEMWKQLASDLKSQLDVKTQTSQASSDKDEYSEEDIKLMQENPRAWLRREMGREMQQRESKLAEESKAQRLKDYEMLTAINKARETLPAFKDVESEIRKLIDREWVGEDPQAIEDLYYSVIGRRNEAIVNYASQKAYKEGYEKAKLDLKMQVDGGGKDSAPIEAGVNVESAWKTPTEELRKMLPKSTDY